MTPPAPGMLLAAQLAQGTQRALHLSRFRQHERRAAHMQEATQPTILSEAADPLAAAAYRAEAWAGEPFLREGEDPAAGARARDRAAPRARRRARRDRGGRREPSLPVEGSLRPDARPRARARRSEPHTASGTELRRHQVDALAGMLTELIAATSARTSRTGTATARGVAAAEDEAERRGRATTLDEATIDDEEPRRGLRRRTIPARSRRYRFRHPTASGKTIAAAGFVEAAARSAS